MIICSHFRRGSPPSWVLNTIVSLHLLSEIAKVKSQAVVQGDGRGILPLHRHKDSCNGISLCFHYLISSTIEP